MDYIYVLCGGKCGSSTLEATFVNNSYKCLRTHGSGEYAISRGDPVPLFDRVDESCINYTNVYIIDSYRTPIERKLSSFFQNISSHLPNYEALTIQELINWFNANLLFHLEEYHSINEAFANYNLPSFTKFDFTKRYNIVQHKNITFIKLLFKDIHAWGEILSEIFQKEIIIHNSNLTEDKEINNLYKKFKELYKVPQTYLYNTLLQDAEFKIYNTEIEQADYIRIWSQRTIE